MFLFIFEDGSIKTTEKVSIEDMKSCDDGILDIIDVSGDVPLQYYGGELNRRFSYEQVSRKSNIAT